MIKFTLCRWHSNPLPAGLILKCVIPPSILPQLSLSPHRTHCHRGRPSPLPGSKHESHGLPPWKDMPSPSFPFAFRGPVGPSYELYPLLGTWSTWSLFAFAPATPSSYTSLFLPLLSIFSFTFMPELPFPSVALNRTLFSTRVGVGSLHSCLPTRFRA